MCRYALHPLSVAQFNGNYFRHRSIFGALNENSGHTLIYIYIYIYCAWMTKLFLSKQTNHVGKSLWYKKSGIALDNVWKCLKFGLNFRNKCEAHFKWPRPFYEWSFFSSIRTEWFDFAWITDVTNEIPNAIARPKFQPETKFSL